MQQKLLVQKSHRFLITSRERPKLAPRSRFKKVFFLQKEKYTIKISSVLHCQIIPQGIRLRLENHFYHNWRQQNLSKN